ncbi:peptidoglycan DD-metalloendopeptidase family protein [Paenibacillus sp. YPG26]|uniref:peptidoglycan DD-metalloendopeptidase family protein n=1 Tax=Paenibacillus sp. YPG26 TaxID=2878915 RepID=UPI00203CE1E3|nr:peptidoglycan DD-metalloendopeptidase family protein [Paenibacillus sp. YPG26]USB33236.1 peptidoglycan DD-metalloendopeptidase family protein [Paenibacillus sp. YPG26]
MKGSNPKSKLRLSIITAAGGLLAAGSLFWAGQQYVEANTIPYYRVYKDGQEVGTVRHKEELTKLYHRKQAEYKLKYPDANIELDTDQIQAVYEKAYKAEVDQDTAIARLGQLLKPTAVGVELKVDGKVIGIVKDKAAAAFVLSQVKNRYIPESKPAFANKIVHASYSPGRAKKASSQPQERLESAAFVEKIDQSQVETDPAKVLSTEEALRLLTRGQEKTVTYKVKPGDTFSSIAGQSGISRKELMSLNPGIKEKALQIDESLKLPATEPVLTVKTVESIAKEAVTSPEVEVRKTNQLRKGVTKVVSPGVSGRKVMSFRVVKENGQVVQKQFLSQKVMTPSRPKVVLQGTKAVSTSGSGRFAWPVTAHSITSTFGERWNKLHKGIDLISSNYSILAADGGTVSFAGVKSGYGNCVVINHGNGYETLYGHLSQIDVNRGDKVGRGEHIGIMGDTGHSFGIHLHFEIHKNGSVQNPIKYLG